MSDPEKKNPDPQQNPQDPHVPVPERTGDLPDEGSPRPEVDPASPKPEIPAKPSRDVPKPDRERAENEGMVDQRPKPPEGPPSKGP